MSFLQRFKGRTERTPKQGIVDILLNRTQDYIDIQDRWMNSNQQRTSSLNKLNQREHALQIEIQEINDIYQLRRNTKALTEENQTPKLLFYRKNDSALRSAKNILKY